MGIGIGKIEIISNLALIIIVVVKKLQKRIEKIFPSKQHAIGSRQVFITVRQCEDLKKTGAKAIFKRIRSEPITFDLFYLTIIETVWKFNLLKLYSNIQFPKFLIT